MQNNNRKTLDPRHLWIACAPAAIFALGAVLIYHFARPFDAPPEFAGSFDPYKAGAARNSVLAATILFIGACIAAIGYFVSRWVLLDGKSRQWTLLAFFALVGGASFIQEMIPRHTTTDFAGLSIACFAADQSKAPAPRLPPAREDRAAAPAQEKAGPVRIYSNPDCGNDLFKLMALLAWLQTAAVFLAFSALVCGAISTLASRPRPAGAGPERPSAEGGQGLPAGSLPDEVAARIEAAAKQDEADLQHWEERSEALNGFLYLGAFLLATSLLFINAYLRWPTFVLAPTPTLEAYLVSLVAYYGYTFSVMLGAFYIPAALLLSRRVVARKDASAGDPGLPVAFKGPLQALKIVLAISSTAIAGALPDILKQIA